MQCAKCKYDFCWICLEEWKKHSSSTGGYYRCTRYEVIQQVEEQSKEMTEEAEKKHKSFQELDRFMHYYTRFKNHEHSYQLEQRLLKTAKEKMEQLSRALSGREGGPPDTTFIEDAVLELLKTRRILKCSYPYGFFLEPKSTKKEIYELMQEYAEFQYRRRHRQRRRGDMSSLRSSTPDPDDPSDSTLDTQDVGGGRRQGPLMGLGSLDDDDPNILLAIQLSLQDSGMTGSGSSQEVLANEASLGAIGTSLPSRLEQSAPGVEVLPRASLSSSELLELGDNLARLGNINISSQYSAATVHTSVQHCDSRHRAYGASVPIPVGPGGSNSSTGLFSSSSDTGDSTTCGSHDPSSSSGLAANANLLGNIMAWFHDMNPQGITLVPSTSSDTDSNLGALHAGGGGCVQDDEKAGVVVLPQEVMADVGFCSQRLSDKEEKECAIAERPTQLDLVGLDTMPLPYMAALDPSGDHAERGGSKVCHVDTPRCDSVSDQLPSTSSSEWEEQVHLV
ncbi:ankyrin repeat and IBR domain-containing protein 1 [Lates japonicus]|uniref:Ankyrin repeat and IBR domain-containing protein 1 n=1 Tax=Lates japonicus TaxID=270547 RepID=A0AAD3RG60_LATJO|nr:ankyrin repeat and IBR domain-containing protein 1 [Lates japonicus]